MTFPEKAAEFFADKAHRKTRLELSKYCNCATSTITQYLNGYLPMPLHVQQKLAALMKEMEGKA